MAYLGRKGAVAPLTSADIPVGIVEGTDIAFLENASGTQNLGGTYSTERMYLNDSYTLTGDVTITGHLALGTVADSDVVITNDSSARTITGSGTLDGGNVLQDTHRTSVTGMTGELGTGVTLGSAVTGSPNLNLGNATFPAGYVVNHWHKTNTYTSSAQFEFTMDGTTGVWLEITYGNNDFRLTGITATQNNVLLISVNTGSIRQVNADGYLLNLGFRIDATDYHCGHMLTGLSTNTQEVPGVWQMTFVVPASFTNKTISARGSRQNSSTGNHYCRIRQDGMPHNNMTIGINIFEIQK